MRPDGSIVVLAEAENTGVETDEVLQVYVENTDCGRAGKHPELCGFLRIHLKEGQKACFEIPVSKDVFTVVGEDGVREEKGTHFVFYVGCSQPDARSLELTGKASLELHYERG